MKTFLKLILLLSLLTISLFAKETIYFMPQDANKAEEKIIRLLENANNTIDIAMYNFTYKKFYKAIQKAIKNDVKVTIIYSKTKLKFSKKINHIKSKRKQHIKLAIIDNKYIIYGSANWKKESFGNNYEIISISNNKKKVQKFVSIYKQLENGEN